MLALGVHERGVSLEFLQRFAQQKDVGKRASTVEVCEQEVKPPALRRDAGEARCGAATRRATDAMGQKIARAYGYATHTKAQGFISRPPLLTTNKDFFALKDRFLVF